MAKTSSLAAKVKTPLHLRLTNEDWVDTFKALTRAELGVFYWIRTKDPYGDRELEINCADLGKELEIHKSSVSRALQSLASKKLIELELISVKVRQKISNRRLTLLCKEETESNQEKTEENKTVAPVQQQTHQCNSKRISATANAPVQQQTHQCNAQPSKRLSDKASSTLQTIKTYSNFIHTLSESERESFWNFGLKKCKSLPKLPELPIKWIEVNWQELYAQFKSTPEAAAASIADTDWTQHQDWEDWLAQMREGVPRFVALGTCFDNQTRRAIADWALERGLIWGAES